MSIVLLMANKNEVFLCGDKRITTVKQTVDGKLTDYAYDDQGRKIYKINERVVIGAAGSVGIQEMFWEPAIRRGQINEDNQRCEYKDFVRCFDKRLHEVFKIVEAEHLPKAQAEFECVIAGGERSEIRCCVYSIVNGEEIVKSHTFEEQYGVISLGIHGYNGVFLEAFKRAQEKIEERIKTAFEQMIQAIKKDHNGVSLDYDIEHISIY